MTPDEAYKAIVELLSPKLDMLNGLLLFIAVYIVFRDAIKFIASWMPNRFI
ncbi:hypothetical protein GNF86_14915 [Clostridium perfringens]|jgi:hypothetical protein